jgi:hypothetical protein
VRSGLQLLVAVVLISGAGVLSCHASVKADANAKVEGGEGDENGDYLNQPVEPGSGEAAEQPEAYSLGPTALLGARHDLRPSPSIKTATCQCLVVVLGQSNDKRLSWQGTPPSIDAESQLVIALSSDGMSCPGAPADSLGASYWGYRVRGDDVIVVVEAARQGRPITTGAIIPKPFGAGQVYLEPASRGLVYGKPLGGGGPCKLGNPGGARTRQAPPGEPETTPQVDFSD